MLFRVFASGPAGERRGQEEAEEEMTTASQYKYA